jgi:hypothetical protein
MDRGLQPLRDDVLGSTLQQPAGTPAAWHRWPYVTWAQQYVIMLMSHGQSVCKENMTKLEIRFMILSVQYSLGMIDMRQE